MLDLYLYQNGIDDSEAYLLEFRTAEPPSIKRIPELLAFCRATERDSSYVVPPTMNMTTSWGLLKDKVHVIQTILPKTLCNFLLSYLNIIIITSTIKDHHKYKLMSNPTIQSVCDCKSFTVGCKQTKQRGDDRRTFE